MGGLWLWNTRVLSGLVIVVVPSGLRAMVQFHWCTRIRWWKVHKRIILVSLVAPPLLRGRTVGSDRGALPGLLLVGFPGPPAEPGVRL